MATHRVQAIPDVHHNRHRVQEMITYYDIKEGLAVGTKASIVRVRMPSQKIVAGMT